MDFRCGASAVMTRPSGPGSFGENIALEAVEATEVNDAAEVRKAW